ncbi:uncharacterized protein JCM15063_004217 [Sporobolomyces koalae]|uniref:uncharacterized protein n=1 Tax=Sporobolomyces koalae TaxID=500713 RepID=UPI00317757D8
MSSIGRPKAPGAGSQHLLVPASTSAAAIAHPGPQPTNASSVAIPPPPRPIGAHPSLYQPRASSLDQELRSRLEAFIPRLLQLFRHQSRTLEHAADGGTGPFDWGDVPREEADELSKAWFTSMKQLSDQDRKTREKLMDSVVDEMGQLLTLSISKIDPESLARRAHPAKKILNSTLQPNDPNSASSSSSVNGAPAPVPHVDSGNTIALSEALSRIKSLESKLSRTHADLKKARQETADQEKSFGERLRKLEERTVDPRPRIRAASTDLSTGVSTNALQNGGATIPAAMGSKDGEFASLKKEMASIKGRVQETENGLGKRKREESDDGTRDRAKMTELESLIAAHSRKLDNARNEYIALHEKLSGQLAAYDLPASSSPTHPGQLSKALDQLSSQVSRIHSITELESNLLRGFYDFLCVDHRNRDEASGISLVLDPELPALYSGTPVEDVPVLVRDRLSHVYKRVAQVEQASNHLEDTTFHQASGLGDLNKAVQRIKNECELLKQAIRRGQESVASLRPSQQQEVVPNAQSAKGVDMDDHSAESDVEEGELVAKQLGRSGGKASTHTSTQSSTAHEPTKTAVAQSDRAME